MLPSTQDTPVTLLMFEPRMVARPLRLGVPSDRWELHTVSSLSFGNRARTPAISSSQLGHELLLSFLDERLAALPRLQPLPAMEAGAGASST